MLAPRHQLRRCCSRSCWCAPRASCSLAPIFGTNEVPPTVRALLAFALALIVAPVQAATMPVLPDSLIDFSLMLAAETADRPRARARRHRSSSRPFNSPAAVIGQLSGMSLGDVFNPGFERQHSALLALAVPGHARGLRRSSAGIACCSAGCSIRSPPFRPARPSFPAGIETIARESAHAKVFELGLRAAAPADRRLAVGDDRARPGQPQPAAIEHARARLRLQRPRHVRRPVASRFGGAAWLLQDRLEPTIEAVAGNVRSRPPLTPRNRTMAEQDGDKTQDATPHRRQEAREQGEIAQSRPRRRRGARRRSRRCSTPGGTCSSTSSAASRPGNSAATRG